MSEVHIATAFLAGLASFLSPCVLPLLPGYLSLVSGLSLEQLAQERAPRGRRMLGRAALFVLGFSLVFCLLGAGAGGVAGLLGAYRPWLMRAAGLAIVLFGIHFTGLLRITALYRERRLHLARVPSGPLGAFVMGLAFAFGWTPCVGPILAAILTYAAGQGTVAAGVGLLAVYSAGLGVPFLIAAVALDRLLGVLSGVKRHFRALEIATGALLVVMGLLMLANQLGTLSRYLPAFGGLAG